MHGAPEWKAELVTGAERLAAKARELRRRIHARPEPGFEEVETAKLAADALSALGIETRTGVAGTGVVGILRGRAPGRCVLLRSELDALRKEETAPEAERPHRSRRPGFMHACGHDGHIAILLGAAECLARMRERFAGTVKFVFQPAEEIGEGGRRLVEEGVLRDPDVGAAFALHAWPELPCGTFGFLHGTSMAAAADFVVEILGRSGHAAFPHLCADPVPAAAAVITALQTIRSRELGPRSAGVVSVTSVETGSKTDPAAPPGADPLRPSATNIIPQAARLKGTSRALTAEDQAMQLERIEEIARAVASAHGTEARFATLMQLPPTVHDRAMTDFAAAVAEGLFGRERVSLAEEPTMGGEDFSFYLQKVPGTFVRLGTGRWRTEEERAAEPGLHSDAFDFNDDALVPGMVFTAGLALEWLAEKTGR